MQADENAEPGTPQHDLFRTLDIHYAEYEDEFIEGKVPKLVSEVLQKRSSQNINIVTTHQSTIETDTVIIMN